MRRGFAFGARELGGEDFVVVVEADPVLAGGLAHGHEFLDGGALRLGFFHLFLEAGLVVAYDHLDFGRVESVFQVFGGEHVRCRDGDGSDAVQCEQEKPELVTAAEDEHHAVALLDSLFHEEVRGALGGKREVLERVDVAFVVVVAPHQCFALGFRRGIFVHDVIGEVEVFRDSYLEILV